jgi:serine/threonine-protein kinase
VGQYTLEEKIGEGGMGQVYKAHHALLKRPVAIKLLKPELVDRENIVRFEREAQSASRLTHPNTIAIYDYGVTADGAFYYVMEYVAGRSLDSLVASDGPLPRTRAVHLLRQVCYSLREAHALGLVHRDLKPQNIMVSDRGGDIDVVKVLDFGLVKDITAPDSDRLTTSSVVAGTPLYIAPERLRDPRDNTFALDIYSWGAVAFFVLTGREVFQGVSVADLFYQVLNCEPPRPSQIAGVEIPAELDQLVLACLAKTPEQRPPSIIAVLERLP